MLDSKAFNWGTSLKMKSREEKAKQLPVIGWREWVSLPTLNVSKIKAKVDSGARSSSLHAFEIHEFSRDGKPWVRFTVHPQQRDTHETVQCEAEVFDKRMVKSSSGKATLRPVILAQVELNGLEFQVELTLANRDAMGFRMLLGREATRRRFLVDTGASYYGGRAQSLLRKKTKKNSTPKEAR